MFSERCSSVTQLTTTSECASRAQAKPNEQDTTGKKLWRIHHRYRAKYRV